VSGDWIPVELSLHDKPEVRRLARETGLDADSVVGKLVRVWAWFNRNTSDGRAAGLVGADVDDLAGHQGFAAQMAAVGWLGIAKQHVEIPNFDVHNPSTSKTRASANARQARYRARKRDATRDVTSDVTGDASVTPKKVTVTPGCENCGKSFYDLIGEGTVIFTSEKGSICGKCMRAKRISGGTGDVTVTSPVTPESVTNPLPQNRIEEVKERAKDIVAADAAPLDKPKAKKPKAGRVERVNDVELPTWLPLEPWREYLAMRKTIHKPLTPRGARKIIAKLDTLRAAGNDPSKVLERSVDERWRGVFELPPEERNRKAAPTPSPAAPEPKRTPMSAGEHERNMKRLDSMIATLGLGGAKP
jgi:hypothetical protein